MSTQPDFSFSFDLTSDFYSAVVAHSKAILLISVIIIFIADFLKCFFLFKDKRCSEGGCLRILLWAYYCKDKARSHSWPLQTEIWVNSKDVALKQRKIVDFNGQRKLKVRF